MGEHPFLFCFPVFLFNSSACQLKRWNSFADVYIFSFKFLYLSGSFDTTKNYVPKNSYACLSLKLCAEIH